MTQNGHNVFLRSMYGYGFPILEPWATINSFSSTRWSINPPLDLKPQCGRIIIQIKRQNSTEEILEAPFQRDEWWMKWYSWDPGHFNRIWLHFCSLTLFWHQKLSWGVRNSAPHSDYKACHRTLILNDFASLNSVLHLSLLLHLIVDSREMVLCYTTHFSWSVVNIERTIPFAGAHYICFVLIRS